MHLTFQKTFTFQTKNRCYPLDHAAPRIFLFAKFSDSFFCFNSLSASAQRNELSIHSSKCWRALPWELIFITKLKSWWDPHFEEPLRMRGGQPLALRSLAQTFPVCVSKLEKKRKTETGNYLYFIPSLFNTFFYVILSKGFLFLFLHVIFF